MSSWLRITTPAGALARDSSCLVNSSGEQVLLQEHQEELDKYDHLVSALRRTSVLLVQDLPEHAYEYQPYTALKEQLLSSHELANFERIERLMKLEPLVGSNPTDLQVEMM